jgi:hypothetical protein
MGVFNTSTVHAQDEVTSTPQLDVTEGPVEATATSTIDPCNPEVFDQQGEEVNPCASPTPTETVDPCAPGEQAAAGFEADPCATPSPTEPVATVIPSATPTLEYEIDVPVSFFPSETAIPGNEETVAAAETEAARATGTAESEEVDGVTELPNAGGSGPDRGSFAWLTVLALMAFSGASALILRSRRSTQH